MLVLLLAAFAGGALTAGLRGWFQPLATVHILNASGDELRDLRVTVRVSGGSSAMHIDALAPDAAHTLRFHVAGEGAYTLEATLADGRKLTGGVGYVESGYRTEELIRADRIESRYR